MSHGSQADAQAETTELVRRILSAGIWSEQVSDDCRRLSLIAWGLDNPERAAHILGRVAPVAGDDVDFLLRWGSFLAHAGNAKEALKPLVRAAKRAPENPDLQAMLAHCLGTLGQQDQSRKHATRALKLKARSVASEQCWPLPSPHPPAFQAEDRVRNVISFSLWSGSRQELDRAVQNIIDTARAFPGWHCRVFCAESISPRMRFALQECGAFMFIRPDPVNAYEALFWRLSVVGDPSVERFLIRNAFEPPEQRDVLAVDAWRESRHWFHVMRRSAADAELIPPCSWGGVNGALPLFTELVDGFRATLSPAVSLDALFTRQRIWPTLRQSCLIHDDFHQGLGAVPFPS